MLVKYQASISSLQRLLFEIDVSRFYKLNEFRILFCKMRLACCLQQVGHRPDEEGSYLLTKDSNVLKSRPSIEDFRRIVKFVCQVQCVKIQAKAYLGTVPHWELIEVPEMSDWARFKTTLFEKKILLCIKTGRFNRKSSESYEWYGL